MSKRWWFLAALMLLIFVIIQVPARVVMQRVLPANPAFSLHNINGSLWQGRADVMTPKITLHNVQWTMYPLHLILGRVQADIVIDDGDVQASADARIGFGGALLLREVSVSLPANKLDELLPMRGLQMQGELHADISELRFAEQQIQHLQAQLQWRDAAVRTPMGTTELGAYRADVARDEAGAIAGDIKDIDGVLDLQGKVVIANQTLSFSGSVKRELPDHVLRFFKMFARDNGSRLEFNFNRPLPGVGP